MPVGEPFSIERRGATDLPVLHDDLLSVYAAANDEHRHVPYFQPDSFWERLSKHHALADDFLLVLGRVGNTAVGFAFGSPRQAAQEIWGMVRRALPDVPARDDTEPIYVLREIAVRPAYQGHGYGHALHDTLLAGRPERLAQLLVLPDNTVAKRAYHSWGWRDVGPRQPSSESPVGDAMVKVLR
jgi:ribosomal protein S18 acetylase RimI-like enzyme